MDPRPNDGGWRAWADGSCLGNPGPGGWGIVMIDPDGVQSELSGSNPSTTNNRMEITAAIEALRRSPLGAAVTIRTDSKYLVNTMTLGWKRRENLDLWKILDAEVTQRNVRWEWVRGHAGDPCNERADELARSAALGRTQDAPPNYSSQPSAAPANPAPANPSDEGQQNASSDGSFLETAPKPQAALFNGEAEELDEVEIARRLRPLLAVDETLRRCASCHRAFVAKGNPPRLRAYCSLASCQLERRRTA